MPPRADIRRRLGCTNCKKAKRKCDEQHPCRLCQSKGLTCSGPQSIFQVTVTPQSKAEPHCKKEATTTVKTEEIASLEGEDEAVEHIVRNSNADEERLALERQPSISWADVAHQSFLPRTMHRSRTCGLVQPWQIVLESQRGPRSPALNAVISASSLQAFAREAPEEVRARLLVEGAGQYGKSLRLVNTLLKNGATAVSNAALVSVMGLAAYGLGAGVRFREHLEGIREMFRLRGPSLLEDQSSRLILKAFRDRAIFAGICQHGDLPFNRKDHPWFFVELGASYFDQLQLIALSMPAILRRYMVLAGSEEPTREDHEQLVTDTYTILADFRSWYARLPELMLPVNGCDSSACGRMLQWYRLCEIICMVVLNRSLSFLSSTASHSDGQERHKVERALISSETRESLKALGMAFQILPRPNGVTPAQDRMAALERFAGSKCLLHTLLTAASIAEVDGDLRAQFEARAHELLNPEGPPASGSNNAQSPIDSVVVKSTYKPVWFTGRTVPLDLGCLENITGLSRCCY